MKYLNEKVKNSKTINNLYNEKQIEIATEFKSLIKNKGKNAIREISTIVMLDFFKFSVKNFDSILEIKTVNGNENIKILNGKVEFENSAENKKTIRKSEMK